MTQDFFLGQLRLIAVAVIAYFTGTGKLSSADGTMLGAVGLPVLLLFGPWLWSIYHNINMKLVPQDSVAISKNDIVEDAAKPGQMVTPQTVQGFVKVVGCLLLALSLTLFSQGDASAQARKLTGNPAVDFAPSAKPADGLPDILKAIDVKVLPDLEYAIRLADASKSTMTGDCLKAWRDLITVRQAAVTDAQGVEIPEPSPHIITDFEKAVEIRNALQSDSPFMVKCAPVASMIKLDVVKFMALIVSGGAGLATLVPGL